MSSVCSCFSAIAFVTYSASFLLSFFLFYSSADSSSFYAAIRLNFYPSVYLLAMLYSAITSVSWYLSTVMSLISSVSFLFSSYFWDSSAFNS